MKTTFKVLFAGTICAVLLASSASAADKPKGAQPLSGNEVAQLFNNKTWKWSAGHGYYGGGGVFHGVFDATFGEGKWFATSAGKLCQEGTWTYVDGNGPFERCWSFLRDPKGDLWAYDHKNTKDGWWRFRVEEKLTKGDTFKREFERTKKALGS